MIDTIRILLGYKCNLKCPYCCNKLPAIRKSIRKTTLKRIDWRKYKTICLTGGEPLLDTDWLLHVIHHVPKNKFVVVNTNGMYLTRHIAKELDSLYVNAMNVGLHDPKRFGDIIDIVDYATCNTGIKVRFNVEDIYQGFSNMMQSQWPHAKFVYWHRDECERNNEDRVIITKER
jgi:molybdenum cofactor biosynthesis enzyme MoaA